MSTRTLRSRPSALTAILLGAALLIPTLADAQTRSRILRKKDPRTAKVDAKEQAQKAKKSDVLTRDISFGKDLAREGDVSLVGLFARQDLYFGIPEYWDVQGNPELRLRIARSAALIPDISSITVWVDGHPAGTLKLDGDPGEVFEKVLSVPLVAKGGYHHVSFVAYHRSRLPCEISDHPGLWSRILEDSVIRVNYKPVAPELSLADWPYPFRDDRDPDAGRVVLAVPEDATTEELKAAGYISSYLGHVAGWRPLDLYVHQGSPLSAPPGHVIAISRLDKASAVRDGVVQLLDGSEDTEVRSFADQLRSAGTGTSGGLALIGRPGDARRAMLTIVGKDGQGVVELARLLSNEESSSLPVGKTEWVDDVGATAQMPERRWEGTVPPETTFMLSDLGFEDRMAVGYRAGVVTIPLHLIPDDHPIAGAARLDLSYSYSAQAAPERSRLDVYLNGTAVGGVALKDTDGRNRVSLLLELPTHEMGPESRLDVAFTLYPMEPPTCIGSDRMNELWGTVHADSKLVLPRDRWSRMPDLSLLRFGAYPFGIHPDLSETLFVIPTKPTRTELQLYAWLAAELGRVSRGDRFGYEVKVGAINRDKDGDRDLVIIDSGPEGSLIKKLGLLDKMSFTPKAPAGVGLALASGGMVALGADPKVAYVEEMALPWEGNRTAIVAYAADATLFERVGRCLDGNSLFDRLAGKVSRIASCVDLAAIPAEDREILGKRPVREAAYEPIRNNYWPIFFGVLLGVALALLVRAAFLAFGRREEYVFEDEEEGAT